MAVDSIMVLLLVAVTFDILLANHHSYIYKYVDTVVLLTLKRHTRTSMALNIYFFLDFTFPQYVLLIFGARVLNAPCSQLLIANWPGGTTETETGILRRQKKNVQ